MGSRFDKSNSLIERGVVEKVELEDATYYRLSERGKLLIESLGIGGRQNLFFKNFKKSFLS